VPGAAQEFAAMAFGYLIPSDQTLSRRRILPSGQVLDELLEIAAGKRLTGAHGTHDDEIS
jgi:hypothetical protein